VVKHIISIDRSTASDPVRFLGAGWSVIEDETDTRSTDLTDVDLSEVLLEGSLKSGETWITGEERLKRLKKAKRIRLDAKTFQVLYLENQNCIPRSWKEKINGKVCFIFFDGTILRGADGNRYALCLFFNKSRWDWLCDKLGSYRNARTPSIVLA
jgi:hypothetical protein